MENVVRPRRVGPHKDNRSGYKGVHWCESERRWLADIRTGNRQTRIGRFDTAEEAALAYDAFVINSLPPGSYTNLIPWADDDWTEHAAFMRLMKETNREEQKAIAYLLIQIRRQIGQAAV